MRRRRFGEYYGNYDGDPKKLLSKLLIFVRTPDEDNPSPSDDFAWCRAENISRWHAAWLTLAEDGYISLEQLTDPAHDEIVVAVRFTQKGYEYAVKATVSDKALQELAEQRRECEQERNASRNGFGLF